MPRKDVSRRAALGALGVGTAAGLGVGAGFLIDRNPASPSPVPSRGAAVTVASWVASRGDHYYIGHRGSGDVYPEHSMEAYSAAVAGGAKCLEISVGMTSDGLLVCMHDLSYNRMTETKGVIAELPSTVLRHVRLTAPQLGPAWADAPQVRVPLFEDVLRAFGGRLVLCVEAKNDAAYPAMIAAVEAHGLQQSVIVKTTYSSRRIGEAKSAGYPVFAYFGSAAEVTPASITTLAGKLDAAKDYLILPITGSGSIYLADILVHQAVATGIPVWVFPAHRRSDANHFFALGCKGVICSSLRYISTNAPSATADTWAFGAVAPGEMTRDPSSATFAPVWSGRELQLGRQGTQHFLTLGQFGPIEHAQQNYTIDLEASWPTLPANPSDNLSLVFGHDDDGYYEHRSGLGNGYHAVLRANGSLELYRHQNGQPDGVQLAKSQQTTTPEVGQWMKFRLAVTPGLITWTRLDVASGSISAVDSTYRGGYQHIGRSSPDGVLGFRALSVS